MPSTLRRCSHYLTISLAISFFFAMLWHNGRGTGDFGWYLAWSNVALSGDIFAIPGEIGSPIGLPLSQWSHGTGFIFAVGAFFLGKGISPEKVALITGWISSIILWWAMFYLVRFSISKDRVWTIFGIIIAYLGTHLGYYSDVYSSELFSFAGLAVMAYWLVSHQKWHLLDSALIGTIGGILISLRPYLGLYVLLGIAIAVYRSRVSGCKRNLQKLIHLVLICLPIAIAAGQVLLVNRWMTGSIFQSPYDFGGGDFKSFDFKHPHLLAILFHPWHGLLIYHPLYFFAFFALVIRVFNRKLSGTERLFMLALALVIVAHIYLQAAWYCWWLGLGTFGMRGLGITAVILVPILVKFISEISSKRFIKYFFLTMVTASCLWSAILMWQGETQFMNYYELLFSQETMVRKHDFLIPLVAAIGLFGIIVWLRAYFSPDEKSSYGLEVLSAVGLAVIFYYVVQDFQIYLTNRLSPNIAIIINIFSALIWVLLINFSKQYCTEGQWNRPPKRITEVFIALAIFATFIISTVLFVRVAIYTEVFLLQSHKINRKFKYISTFHYPEVRATYEEYLKVPGFQAEKEKLAKFLERENPKGK